MPTAGEYKHEPTGIPCHCYVRRRINRSLDRKSLAPAHCRPPHRPRFGHKLKTVTFDPVLRVRSYTDGNDDNVSDYQRPLDNEEFETQPQSQTQLQTQPKLQQQPHLGRESPLRHESTSVDADTWSKKPTSWLLSSSSSETTTKDSVVDDARYDRSLRNRITSLFGFRKVSAGTDVTTTAANQLIGHKCRTDTNNNKQEVQELGKDERAKRSGAATNEVDESRAEQSQRSAKQRTTYGLAGQAHEYTYWLSQGATWLPLKNTLFQDKQDEGEPRIQEPIPEDGTHGSERTACRLSSHRRVRGHDDTSQSNHSVEDEMSPYPVDSSPHTIATTTTDDENTRSAVPSARQVSPIYSLQHETSIPTTPDSGSSTNDDNEEVTYRFNERTYPVTHYETELPEYALAKSTTTTSATATSSQTHSGNIIRSATIPTVEDTTGEAGPVVEGTLAATASASTSSGGRYRKRRTEFDETVVWSTTSDDGAGASRLLTPQPLPDLRAIMSTPYDLEFLRECVRAYTYDSDSQDDDNDDCHLDEVDVEPDIWTRMRSFERVEKSSSTSGPGRLDDEKTSGWTMSHLFHATPIALFWTGCAFLVALIYITLFSCPNDDDS